MNNRINDLAHRLANEELSKTEYNFLYTDLIEELQTTIKYIVDNYIDSKGLYQYTIDKDNYITKVTYEAVQHSLHTYDKHKGNFIARLRVIANNCLTDCMRYDRAKKRFNTTTIADSIQKLQDTNPYMLEYGVELSTLNKLEGLSEVYPIVNDFICSDRDGKVINVILKTLGMKQSERIEAFKELFGGTYGNTQSKRVERAKKRLAAELSLNGINSSY